MVGIQLLTVLVVGLLTALALQCVLTTLGTAIALSNWRLEPTAEGSETSGGITAGVGMGVLLTVNAVLFAACFLATRFSGVETVLSGAIAGLVVWAAYLLLVLWVGAIALRSVVGTLFAVTTGGLGRLIKAIQAAFQSPAPEPLSESEMRATMRQEIQAALTAWQPVLPVAPPAPPQPAVVLSQPPVEYSEPDPLWAEVATYLQTTSVKNLTPKRLERKLQKWFQGYPAVPQFTKLELIQVLMQRQDLSAKQRQRILAQLQAAWTPQPEAPGLLAEHPIATKVMQAVVSQAVGEVVAQVEPGKLVEQAVAGLRSQSNPETAEDGSVTTVLEDWLQRSVQQVETIQQAAKEQLATLQQQTQQQLDQTRQTAAAAAWWLFFTAASSALSAAIAGTWATGMNPLQLLRVAQG